MKDSNWQKVETIIDQVLEMPPEERTAFIEQECADDQELKGEVTQLLESIFNSEGWLDNPQEFYDEIADDIGLISSDQSLIGEKVGAYSIKEQIGEGGMGSVYLAERTDDEFHHSVAIKIIRHATETNIRRFKREQQILANLNHPGIATLLDGGVTSDGLLYIIMEYVDGMPIDEYCQHHSCSTDKKINLFKQVLKAVRHAHENLVIHRDLKPGNILVDKSSTVKILDFGISKLLKEDNDLSLTQTGMRLLTPKYAAPEQIKERNITTATDLYALGIIFYELLTESAPFHFDDASRHDIERIILEKEPAKPSSRVDSKKLRKQFQGDLDAITLKAIRKEPGLRYRVANDFLNDIESFKKGLPVTARVDSLQYRSQKFFQRHKQGVVVVTGIILLIIGFVGFYTWRITAERNQAQFEAQRATQVKNLLNNILQQQNPFSQPNREITLAEVLEKGAEDIQKSLNNQPSIKAEMLGLLGRNYASLGHFDKGEELIKKAIRLDPATDNSSQEPYINKLIELGRIYYLTGRFSEAKDVLTKALDQSKNVFGSRSKKLSPILHLLASIHREQGNLDKSEEFYRQSITIADSTQKLAIATALGNLAITYSDRGQFDKAIDLHKESMKLEKEIRDTLHPDLASAHNNMAFTYQRKGNYPKADSLHQIALKMRRQLFPPDHPHIASSLIRLGLLKIKQLRTRRAEALLEEGYQILRKTLPEDHWQVNSAKGGLAVSRAMQGEFEENLPIVEEVYQKFSDQFGADDWRTQEAATVLVNLYRIWGKPEKVEYYSDKLR